MYFGDCLVSWKTKKQSTISRSTVETEYRSLSATVCELLWLSYVAADLQLKLAYPITLWCDNQAALHIVSNPMFHERTKHLSIDCHLVREQFKESFVNPKFVSSDA